MIMYKLTTNSGEFYINRKPTLDEMLAYIKSQLAKGYQYKDILYTWTPIRVNNPPKE